MSAPPPIHHANDAEQPPAESSGTSASGRRWLQFSLRTLLIVMLLAGVLLGYIGFERRRAAALQSQFAGLQALSVNTSALVGDPSPRPGWLRAILGDDSPAYLRSISLAGRKVDDAKLAGLASFPRLEVLSLLCTEVRGPGLELLTESPRLRRLDLGASTIGDEGMKSVGKLTGLTDLVLGNTRISGQSLNDLAGLSRLRRLNLHRTDIADDHLTALAAWPELRVLQLSRTQVTDAGLEHLEELQLDSLDLSETRVTDDGIVALRNLPLRELVLTGTDVQGTRIGLFTGFRRLQAVDLEHAPIAESCAWELATLPMLEHLNLSRTNVTDAIIPALASCRRLTRVNLKGTKLTREGFDQLQQARPELTIVR
ncbi:MAG: hypothetical protein MUF06_10360 [Pirellulaceae bacterium]|nr:hypothetical protein [Pirellulaceae bacterium]